MSITTTNVKNEYTVSSSTSSFSFTFRWFDLTEIEVLQDGTTLVQDTDYTFSGTTSSKIGGQVDLTTAMSSGELVIKRVTPVIQEADYGTTNVFPATTSQGVDDRAVAMIQEIDSLVEGVPEFPSIEADAVLGWNSAGTALENKTLPDVEEYEELAQDVADAQDTADSAQTDATAAQNTADSAQLDADGAKVTATSALTLAQTNETDLATTEAKASSALSLATNNAADIAAIDTTVFMDKTTYVPRLDAVEALADANELQSTTNADDLIDVKSDISDIQTDLEQFTQSYDQYIGNNVLVATELNGVALNRVENTFAYISLNGYRSTDDNSTNFTIQLYAFWDSVLSIWKIGRLSSYFDDVDGITFDIATTGDIGTITYLTTDITGANYDGHAYYRADKILR